MRVLASTKNQNPKSSTLPFFRTCTSKANKITGEKKENYLTKTRKTQS